MASRMVRRTLAAATALLICTNSTPTAAVWQAPSAEHRYRISGKIRLLLFWIGDEDVGGARATWRYHGGGEELALLIGTDPTRAPRGVNEWGYVREQVTGDEARVFGVRTETPADSPDSARATVEDRDRGASFGAICSQVTARTVTTATASIVGPGDLSYRRFDRLLDALAAHQSWRRREMDRPAGAAAGFLTAFTHLMTDMAAARRSGAPSSPPQVRYVYKDAAYDLSADHLEPVAELRTADGPVRNLLRATFRIRNVSTGYVTRFDATFGVDGALTAVPVQATYQPSWWFKIRIELDDDLDVPSLPGGDETLRRRVDEMCAQAAAAHP